MRQLQSFVGEGPFRRKDDGVVDEDMDMRFAFENFVAHPDDVGHQRQIGDVIADVFVPGCGN